MGLKPRSSDTQKKELIKRSLCFNVYAIQKGKAEDPYLKENDIIIVPRSGVKTVLSGVKETFRAAIGVGRCRSACDP